VNNFNQIQEGGNNTHVDIALWEIRLSKRLFINNLQEGGLEKAGLRRLSIQAILPKPSDQGYSNGPKTLAFVCKAETVSYSVKPEKHAPAKAGSGHPGFQIFE